MSEHHPKTLQVRERVGLHCHPEKPSEPGVRPFILFWGGQFRCARICA